MNTPSNTHGQNVDWYAHLTVAVIIENQGRYLCVEEIAEQSEPVLNQPAGHVEPHERIDDAAIRETLEETGWDIEITGIVGFYLSHAKNNDTTYFRVCFTAQTLEHHPELTLDDGIIGARWLTLDELKSSSVPLRSELVLRCIEDFEKGHNLPLHYLQHIGI